MQKMTIIDALALLCKTKGCYGLYLSFGDEFNPGELKKAVPFLDLGSLEPDDIGDYQAVCDEYMFVECKSKAECYRLFNQVVGDDGPTKSNPYNGPTRVYAVTINNRGEIGGTNT